MTILEKMQSFLEREPRARERSKKDNAIRVLLIEAYPSLETVPKDVLIDALRSYSSYDRAWRKILEETPSLRGSDYDQKYELAMHKMDELGYMVQPADYTKLKN